MKFVKLTTSAYVNGVLRHPHEGVLHLEDEEAQRLFDNEAAEDVSDDFTAKEDKVVPVESVTTVTETPPSDPHANPHQAEIAPAPADEKPAPARARKEKE